MLNSDPPAHRSATIPPLADQKKIGTMVESIAGILERKKKELEQEIADFTNMKEDEYKAFEQQVILGACDSVGEVEARDEGKKPEKQDSLTILKEPLQRELFELKKLGFESVDGTARAEERGGPVIKTLETDTNSSQRERSRGWPEGHPGSFDQTLLHEREQEFQGLFTPSFLPLLDDKGRHRPVAEYGQSQFGNDLPAISLDTGKDLHGSDVGKPNLSLSSSASFPNAHHASSLSPPPARPMSASVPRQPSHQRRSSSRSDTSITSLRSSLRDPKQPHSPKRVLFSIEDKVVSPSTSPLMQRANAESSIINASSSTRRDGPESTRTQSNAWDMFPWTQKSSAIAPVGTVLASFRNAQLQPFPTGVSIRSPFLGGDDFERMEIEDDLFAFDEDLTTVKVEGKKGERETIIAGSDENEDGDESLPAGSPHAGSLPIEIKWPSRFVPPG